MKARVFQALKSYHVKPNYTSKLFNFLSGEQEKEIMEGRGCFLRRQALVWG